VCDLVTGYDQPALGCGCSKLASDAGRDTGVTRETQGQVSVKEGRKEQPAQRPVRGDHSPAAAVPVSRCTAAASPQMQPGTAASHSPSPAAAETACAPWAGPALGPGLRRRRRRRHCHCRLLLRRRPGLPLLLPVRAAAPQRPPEEESRLQQQEAGRKEERGHDGTEKKGQARPAPIEAMLCGTCLSNNREQNRMRMRLCQA
jgi:hypothetical protein